MFDCWSTLSLRYYGHLVEHLSRLAENQRKKGTNTQKVQSDECSVCWLSQLAFTSHDPVICCQLYSLLIHETSLAMVYHGQFLFLGEDNHEIYTH